MGPPGVEPGTNGLWPRSRTILNVLNGHDVNGCVVERLPALHPFLQLGSEYFNSFVAVSRPVMQLMQFSVDSQVRRFEMISRGVTSGCRPKVIALAEVMNQVVSYLDQLVHFRLGLPVALLGHLQGHLDTDRGCASRPWMSEQFVRVGRLRPSDVCNDERLEQPLDRSAQRVLRHARGLVHSLLRQRLWCRDDGVIGKDVLGEALVLLKAQDASAEQALGVLLKRRKVRVGHRRLAGSRHMNGAGRPNSAIGATDGRRCRSENWWAPRGSNPVPTDYESAALTTMS